MRYIKCREIAIKLSGLFALLSVLLLTGCQAEAVDQSEQIAGTSLTLVGEDFGASGTSLPSYSICPEETSPGFSWHSAPEGTESYVITMHAPVYSEEEIAAGAEQRPFKYWWILYNVPASASSVKAGGTAGGTLGTNIAKGQPAIGYSPPCPRGGGTDIPVSFTLFALSEKLEFSAPIDVTWDAFEQAMEGKLLESTKLNATFDRVVETAK